MIQGFFKEIFEGGMAPSSPPPGYATACFAKVTPVFVTTNKCNKLKQFKTQCKDDMVNSDN